MDSSINKNITSVLLEIKKSLSEQVVPNQSLGNNEIPKQKKKKVIFDKSTNSPFEVIFSERGFAIEGTRFSFEDIETALSKEYSITLQNGKGMQLDAVKMQKILKYKEI